MAAPDVEIRPATIADAHDLAPRMRDVEVAEIQAADGTTPLEALVDAITTSSEAYALIIGGELACCYGVRALQSSALGGRVGIVWMLTSPVVERKPKAFWKVCLKQVPALLTRWDELVNAIDVRHEKSIRWAKRLGFRLDAPAPFGIAGRDFARFRVTKGDCQWAT
jgi:hypothetical protein